MGRWVWFIAAVLLSGCIEDQLVACDDGLACPIGTTCSTIYGCLAPEQTEQCAGKDDRTPCEFGGPSACFNGVCLPYGCGNAFVEVELGEVCDDGNVAPGDGCSATCQSDESCGNLVRDPGEACDDGGRLSRDGCSSTCQLETAIWTTYPVGPLSVSIGAYDDARRRYVAIAEDGVWELADGRWTLVPVTSVGIPVAAYYDQARASVVGVFDRSTTMVAARWTGTAWADAVTGPSVTPFEEYTTAYDVSRSRGVLVARTAANSRAFAITSTEIADIATFVPVRGASAGYDPLSRRVFVRGNDAMGSFDRQCVIDTTVACADAAPSAGVSTFQLATGGASLYARVITQLGSSTTFKWFARTSTAWVERSLEGVVDGKRIFGSATGLGYMSLDEVGTLVGTSFVSTPIIGASTMVTPVPGGFAYLSATAGRLSRWTTPTGAPPLGPPETLGGGTPGPGEALNGCTWSSGRNRVVCFSAIQSYVIDGPTVTTEFLNLGFCEVRRALADHPARRELWVACIRQFGGGGIAVYPDDRQGPVQSVGPGEGVLALAPDPRTGEMIVSARWGLSAFKESQQFPLPSPTENPVVVATDMRRGNVLAIDQNNGAIFERQGATWQPQPAGPIAGEVFEAHYNDSTGTLLVRVVANGGVLHFQRQDDSILETCEPGVDMDGDTLEACDDPDCYWACSRCPPRMTCRELD